MPTNGSGLLAEGPFHRYRLSLVRNLDLETVLPDTDAPRSAAVLRPRVLGKSGVGSDTVAAGARPSAMKYF